MCVKKIDNVDVRAELQYLDQMKHPNCLSLMGYEIDIDLMVTMVIEYCPYSLESIRVANDKTESVRTRIDYTLARKCIMQVVRGVRYLHNFSEKQSIAHFDIKPDNVVVTLDGVCKIADFGTVHAGDCVLGVAIFRIPTEIADFGTVHAGDCVLSVVIFHITFEFADFGKFYCRLACTKAAKECLYTDTAR